MAKETAEKTKIKSNKWKNENKNARRSMRSSEPQPSTDGFRSSLTLNTKRTSPRSSKTALPPKDKSGPKDAAKKKEKKKKLPMAPTSEPSSLTNIDATDDAPAAPTKDNTPATPTKNNTPAKSAKSDTPATPTKNNSQKSSSLSVNSPTSKNNNKAVKKGYVVFVGNLPYGVQKEQLEEHFRKTGGVKTIRIPKEKGSEKGRGFAYIEFKDMVSHKIALRLHHTHMGGRQINVEFTSIGGKNPRRLEKLKQKNLKLVKMRKEYYPSSNDFEEVQ